MEVKIPYVSVTDANLAYQKVQKQLSSVGLIGLPLKSELSFDAANKKILVSGQGFSAEAFFLSDHVVVKMELSLMLRAFKGKIVKALEDQLKKFV